MEHPDGVYLIIDTSQSNLVRVLGRRCFAPNWQLSGNFRGSNINMARRFYDAETRYDNIVWWQIHVRGWIRNDELFEIHTHSEPDPIMHPDAHANGVGLSQHQSINIIESIFNNAQGVELIDKIER